MIGYVTLGTRDLKKAAAFYDKIAAEMGIGRFMESDTFHRLGCRRRRRPRTDPAVRRQTDDGRQRRHGRLGAKDKAQVDRIYKLALSLGGTDEGPPGPRGEADFTRPISAISEGNKLNAFVMG